MHPRLDWLVGLRNRGCRYGIERMQHLSAVMGHPQLAFPTVHVAGTNGKGSVCALLAAALRQMGYKTGLSTSPHLLRLGERVQVNGRPLKDQELVSQIEALMPLADLAAACDPEAYPSFFEFMTAVGFRVFHQAQVDIAVIETGLGGRLDATNVLEPEVCAITSIGLDHEHILGGTLEKIATEKAGILKPGVPVVLGLLPPVAEAVIRRIASERDCEVVSLAEHYPFLEGMSPEAIAALPEQALSPLPQCSLQGVFQHLNAGVAALILEQLQPRLPVTKEARDEAWRHVNWPGRWDCRALAGNRRVIFDATHNGEGLHMLRGNLQKLCEETGQRPVILTGILGEDRARIILPELAHWAQKLLLAVPNQPRACPIATLFECLPEKHPPALAIEDLAEWLKAGFEAHLKPGQTLVVTGSLYLIGEMMAHLEPQSADCVPLHDWLQGPTESPKSSSSSA